MYPWKIPPSRKSGGRTKWNRTRLGLPKAHSLDAACVRIVDRISGGQGPVLSIKAAGRGSYQRTRLDAFGFPRGYLTRKKTHFGFATGDLVRATVPSGKMAGTHVGRIAVRARGIFNIQTGKGLVKDVPARFCWLLQRADGYGYSVQTLHQKGGAHSAPA